MSAFFSHDTDPAVTSREGRVSRNPVFLSLTAIRPTVTSREGRVSRNIIFSDDFIVSFRHVP